MSGGGQRDLGVTETLSYMSDETVSGDITNEILNDDVQIANAVLFVAC